MESCFVQRGLISYRVAYQSQHPLGKTPRWITTIKTSNHNGTTAAMDSPDSSCCASAWTHSRHRWTSSCWHWTPTRCGRNCLRRTRNLGSGGSAVAASSRRRRQRQRQHRRPRHPQHLRGRGRRRRTRSGSGPRAPATGSAGRSPGFRSAPWCQMGHPLRARGRVRVRDGRHHKASQGQGQPLAAAEGARCQRAGADTRQPRDRRRHPGTGLDRPCPQPPAAVLQRQLQRQLRQLHHQLLHHQLPLAPQVPAGCVHQVQVLQLRSHRHPHRQTLDNSPPARPPFLLRPPMPAKLPSSSKAQPLEPSRDAKGYQ